MGQAEDAVPSISRTGARAVFVGLLVLQGCALSWQAWHLGITYDEPSHLAAGYMYWLGQDVLQPSDTPPLMRMVSGWIPRVMVEPLDLRTDVWRSRSSYAVGFHLIKECGVEGARRLVFLTRLPFLLFPMLTVALLWHWARRLFGEGTALAVACATILEPTLLGHGALIKSDWAATFGCVLFFHAAWRYWQHPGWKSLGALTIALLVAILAKFNMLALIPVALLLVLWRGPRLAGASLILVAVYVGLIAAYQFRIRPITPQELHAMDLAAVPRFGVSIARTLGRLPWPPQLIAGLGFIGHADQFATFPAYMMGHRIEGSAPGYFPLAWAVKLPIALQLLSLAGLSIVVIRLARRESCPAAAFVWGPAALVMLLGIRSHIYIGIRHILPAIPFFILGAGFAIQRLGRWRTGRLALAAAFVWLALAAAQIYPDGISYFNEWAGGPRNGWKYLGGSNIDWGQNLPELSRYVAEHHLEKVTVYYSGTDVIQYYVPLLTLRCPQIPLGTETHLQPEPGVYAISINQWLGYSLDAPYRDYFRWFRQREPDARIAYSMFIYDVKEP